MIDLKIKELGQVSQFSPVPVLHALPYRNQNRARRVTRFTDKDLPDGVHCTEKVKGEIHGIIIADILKHGGEY